MTSANRDHTPTEAAMPYLSLYGGMSGVELPIDIFELGEGVILRRTFAHLMSPNLMAFARAAPGQPHPGPWRAARGGMGSDIEVEVYAPSSTSLGASFDAKETIWWVAALIRLAKAPFLTVPVLSDQPYSEAAGGKIDPVLQPFETEPRIFQPSESSTRVLDQVTLSWIKAKWIPAGHLLNTNPKFYSAIKAFDSATIRGRTSASLLAIWGAVEQLFAPSTAELRFRVASLLASYLERPGSARLDLYKRVLKLYNERSIAAHTAEEIAVEPLLQSYVLMRNTLVRMIDKNALPTQADLEALLFGVEQAPFDEVPSTKTPTTSAPPSTNVPAARSNC